MYVCGLVPGYPKISNMQLKTPRRNEKKKRDYTCE